MNTEPIANRCPKCQAPLPANAPQGLCAKCLLAAVSTPTEAGQPADRKPPPSIEIVAAAFPQLEILELIGHGGMGVVYKARQPRLDRLVALKLLPQSLAADAAFAERFNREARVLARLNHPNIVTVHDFGQSGGFFYLLMEFVDGVNLRQAMQAGRFTPQQAMMLVPKVCEALQFAHDEGILHRDIKPENILLDTKGRVKIADFGVAKLVGEAKENLTLTASGMAVGTPHYMAPEQLEHPQDVDQRADIYSLGVVFYEMLTGELPIGRFAPPSQKSSADVRVDEVVFHALEKEREKRFRTASEVKTSVEAITSNPAITPAQAEAAGGPARPSAAAAIPERRIPCYISTPEHVSTFIGQIVYIYTGKGELRLDAEHLTFVSNWQSTVIPLRDIRELGVGHYSRLAKPVRLDYLAVTFEQASQRRTLLFTPMIRGGISLPWEVNPRVAECLLAVREAIIARTGQAPRGLSSAELPGSAQFDPLRQFIKFGLAGAAIYAVIVSRMILMRGTGPHKTWEEMRGGVIMLLVSGAVLLFIIAMSVRDARARRNRAHDRGSFPGEPPLSPPPGPRPSGGMAMPANPAASPGNPSAGVSSPAEARATCYFNTPARMRDCFPCTSARIFTCKGELELDGENLIFTSPWRTRITMPLKDIEDLSIGQFQMWTTPWVMKYARISFLSVSFRQQGKMHTVHLTPVQPGAVTAGQINDCVGRWFERVRQAAGQCTGTMPHASDTASVSVSAEPAWNRKALPLAFACLLVGLATWVLQGRTVAMSIWLSALLTSALLAIATLWFCVGFLRANSALWHGELDAVTSDNPPAPEPTGAGGPGSGSGRRPGARWLSLSHVGIVAVGLMVALLTGLWIFGNRFSPAAGGRVLGSPSAPETEGKFVLRTMPMQGTSEPSVLRWNFKYLIPAEHLARILFVRWSNGVPVIEIGGSAYYKVGKISMDQHLFVSCPPLAVTIPSEQLEEYKRISSDLVSLRRREQDLLTSFTEENAIVKGARAKIADAEKRLRDLEEASRLTNTVPWGVSLFGQRTALVSVPGEAAYRRLEMPARLTVGSGHQGILRLVDYVTPEGQAAHDQSGVELRIFLEPMKSPPIRTDPFEVEGTNYVAGSGPGWTTVEALKAIKQWPADQ